MGGPLEETIRLLDLPDDCLGALAASGELQSSVTKPIEEFASRRQALAPQDA